MFRLPWPLEQVAVTGLYTCLFFIQLEARAERHSPPMSPEPANIFTLSARDLLPLNGVRTDSIDVFISHNGKLISLPSQIDERVRLGSFLVPALEILKGNSLFDGQDVLLFRYPERVEKKKLPLLKEFKKLGYDRAFRVSLKDKKEVYLAIFSGRAKPSTSETSFKKALQAHFHEEKPLLPYEISVRQERSNNFQPLIKNFTLSAFLNFRYFLKINLDDSNIKSKVIDKKSGPLQQIIRTENEFRIPRLNLRATFLQDTFQSEHSLCTKIVFDGEIDGGRLFLPDSHVKITFTTALSQPLRQRITPSSVRVENNPWPHSTLMLPGVTPIRAFLHLRPNLEQITPFEAAWLPSGHLSLSFPLSKLRPEPSTLEGCVETKPSNLQGVGAFSSFHPSDVSKVTELN